MRAPRIFHDGIYAGGDRVQLTPDASHHVINVLHMKPDQPIILFNGSGGYFDCIIQSIVKKHVVVVDIGQFYPDDKASKLNLTLVQGISRGQRMDYTLQKAVELGVTTIVPVFCKFCNVKLAGDRQDKRLQHWRNLIINACEQCGLNRIPLIQPPLDLADWVKKQINGLKIILHPASEYTLSQLQQPDRNIILLAGPEGGFSEEEVCLAVANGYHAVRFGPRTLRTESAALVAITACQVLWGDIC